MQNVDQSWHSLDPDERINVLRRQLAIYRAQLRSSFDPEFVSIYAREVALAQYELARLVGR